MKFETVVPLPEHMAVFTYVHAAMRRDAHRLVDTLSALPPEDTARARAVRSWFERFHDALDHHHRFEDEFFWPAVRARTHEFAAVEPLMEEQHHLLDEHLEAVGRALTELAAASARAWKARLDQAEGAATVLRSVLVEHLASEETTALSLMAEHLSPKEFAAVERRVSKRAGLRYVAFALPWVLDGLPTGDAAALMRATPLPFRWVHRFWWQPAYRRLVRPLTAPPQALGT